MCSDFLKMRKVCIYERKKESLDGTLIGEERILHLTLIERLLLLPFASWIMMIAVVSSRTEGLLRTRSV